MCGPGYGFESPVDRLCDLLRDGDGRHRGFGVVEDAVADVLLHIGDDDEHVVRVGDGLQCRNEWAQAG
jgi:hypothetical protein